MKTAAGRSASVLFSDERLLALDKPSGLSLATSRREPGAAVARLVAAVPSEERAAHGLDGNALLVHRLDVGTSGVVLLAREPEAHRELAGLFEKRRVGKHYLALVWGHPRPRKGLFDAPLGPDPRDRRRMRADPAGRRALTHYETRGVAPHAALLALRPETGRTHQIRVHLAHAGHPVVGDDLYAGPRERAVREPALRAALAPPHTLLHAARIELPATSWAGERIIEAPLPPAFLAALRSLGLC